MDKISGRCPICNGEIIEEPEACPKCLVPYCASCWEYNGGCGIYGCEYKIGEILIVSSMEITHKCPLCNSSRRLNCVCCETSNCMDCFGSSKIACLGCGWIPEGWAKYDPLVVTSERLPRISESKRGALQTFGSQMLQTWEESLCPTDPIVKGILFAIFTFCIAPVWLLVVYMLVNIGGHLDLD